MLLQEAKFTNESFGKWFIWSINDETVSCLPYNYIGDDEASMFIWDLKEFLKEDVLNA